MEEVVAIDERLGLPDLESDRATLANMRQRQAGEEAPGPPIPDDLPEVIAMMEANIDKLPPQLQAPFRQFMDQLKAMSPAKQVVLLHQMARQQVQTQAEQVVQAALAAHQSGRVKRLVPQLEMLATQVAGDEEPGSPMVNLAQFIRAVIALLQGQSPEPVVEEYAERLAALQEQLKE